MLKRLSLTALIGAIQKRVAKGTGLPCYDHVENNTPSPFYYAEIVSQKPANTKTMFRDTFTVWIHAIAEPGESSVRIYQLIEKLEEAMTKDIVLPNGFEMILQIYNGIQTIKTDETNEKHAVMAYEFMVCYGFRCKI